MSAIPDPFATSQKESRVSNPQHPNTVEDTPKKKEALTITFPNVSETIKKNGTKPKIKKRKPKSAIPQETWTKIKLKYETGTDTIKKIADGFSVNSTSITNRAKRENWQVTRETPLSDQLSREFVLKTLEEMGLGPKEQLRVIVDGIKTDNPREKQGWYAILRDYIKLNKDIEPGINLHLTAKDLKGKDLHQTTKDYRALLG